MSRRKKIRIAAVPVAIVFCLLSFGWPQVNVVATILLLYITLEYVLANQENLDLFRHQLERQERVFLHFDLLCKNGPLYVRVANLGISNFLVTAIHVRTQDLAEFHYSAHQVVESGKSEEISLPRDACADHPLSVDLEITLEFVGLDIRGKTEPKCFNVSMALDNIPDKTTEGLNGLWGVRCPRCNLGGMLFMSMRNNMKTFTEALARKQLLLADLGNSCPDHQSEWLMGMNDVNVQQNPSQPLSVEAGRRTTPMLKEKKLPSQRQDRFWIWVGTGTILATFVVRQEWREQLKDLVSSVSTAEDMFVVQRQNAETADMLHEALVRIDQISLNVEGRKSINSAQRERVTTIFTSVISYNQETEVSLDNIRRLVERLPQQEDYKNRLAKLEKERAEISSAAAQTTISSPNDIPTEEVDEASEKAVNMLAFRTSALEKKVQSFTGEVLKEAEELKTKEETRYRYVTYGSRALYVFGIILGVIGKLLGKEVSPAPE